MKRQKREASFYDQLLNAVRDGYYNQFRKLLGLKPSREKTDGNLAEFMNVAFNTKSSVALAAIYDSECEYDDTKFFYHFVNKRTIDQYDGMEDLLTHIRSKNHPKNTCQINPLVIIKLPILERFLFQIRGDSPKDYDEEGYKKRWLEWNPYNTSACELSLPFCQSLFTLMCVLNRYDIYKDLRYEISKLSAKIWWEKLKN